MNIAIYCIYAVIALIAIIFMGLREFHMLQLNGYKTPEHSWWMKKNFKRYIPHIIMLILSFSLLCIRPVIFTLSPTQFQQANDPVYRAFTGNLTKIVLCVMAIINICFII